MNRCAHPLLLTPALVLMLTLSACRDKPAALAPAVTAVEVAPAVSGPALPPLTTTGLIWARDEMKLSFKLGGVVADVAVHNGERVRKGQVLARLEPAEVDAMQQQAQLAHDKAQRDLARGERLQADEVIPLEQLQNLRTQESLTAAQLRAASFNHGYANIVAPRDATVLRRLVEPHELVAPGQPVVVLGAQDSGYVVRMGLSDRELVQVHTGDVVTLRLDAFAGVTFSARVTRIAAAADERSGLFEVEAQLAASQQQPVTGMVAQVSLQPGAAAAQSLVYVPVASVLEGDGGRATVYVLREGKAVQRRVEVAFISPAGVALRAGLTAGEQVITTGAAYVRDGVAVKLP